MSAFYENCAHGGLAELCNRCETDRLSAQMLRLRADNERLRQENERQKAELAETLLSLPVPTPSAIAYAGHLPTFTKAIFDSLQTDITRSRDAFKTVWGEREAMGAEVGGLLEILKAWFDYAAAIVVLWEKEEGRVVNDAGAVVESPVLDDLFMAAWTLTEAALRKHGKIK